MSEISYSEVTIATNPQPVSVVSIPAITGAVTVSGNVNTGGTLNNGTTTVVTQVAVQILAANANRKKLLIQSISAGTIAIGTTGITNTTGIQLAPNSSLTFDMPNCPTNAIFAVRTTNGNTTVVAQEVV